MTYAVLSSWASQVKAPYPKEAFDIKLLPHITSEDCYKFVCLWLMGGIPYAFKDQPMLFEAFRQKLALNLNIHPVQIGITGSGRIGFSLSPSRFCGDYDRARSDLDLFVVDAVIFASLVEEFSNWMELYKTNKITPRNSTEKIFWDENLVRTPGTIKRGFVDTWKIPNFAYFPMTTRCAEASAKAKTILSVAGFIYKGNGLRIFRDSDAAVKVKSFNLMKAIETVLEG